MPQDLDSRERSGSTPEERTPRPVKAIGTAVILLLLLAIVLLATGVVDMTPLGGP
jgi:hypothetical protein